MKIVTKEQVLAAAQPELLRESIFIYPTDTIYGIGCDATNEELVKKVREIKQRESNPFSIIPPTKEWIEQHCKVTEAAEEWLAKLPGPYTLIMQLQDPATFPAVTMHQGTIGIRIPEHWFTGVAQQLNVPIVTTSVNIAGQPPLTNPKELRPAIEEEIDILIDDGEINRRPSTIIRLDKEPVEIIER